MFTELSLRGTLVRADQSGRVRQSGRRDWLIVGSAIGALAAVRAGTIEEGDPYWQIRAGLENLAGTPLVRPDSWGWAPTGGDFYPNSPAWNVILALGWQAAGFWGMFAITFVSVASFGALVAVAARALGARPLAILVGAVPMLLLALPMLSPRATLPAQTLFLFAVLLGWCWNRSGAERPGWVTGLGLAIFGLVVSTVGNWLHLSWAALAAATAVAWTVMWLLTPGVSVVRRLATSMAGATGLGLGVVLGPYGVAGTVERSRVVAEACTSLIAEWTSPFTPGLALRWGPAAVLALLVAAASVVRVVRRLRAGQLGDPRVRLQAGLAFVGAGTALAGLTAVRFAGLALFALAPLAPVLVPSAARIARGLVLRAPSTIRVRAAEWTSERFWRPVAAGVVIVLAPLSLLGAAPHAQPPGIAAIAQVPSGCRVFASWELSAAVILLRPDLTVWADGRADYYGRQRIEDAISFFYGVGAPRGLTAPDGAQCAIFPTAAADPDYTPVVERLDADPAWVRTATTGEAALWFRAGVV